MKIFGYIVLSILIIIGLLAMSWGMGWFGIFYKSTIGVKSQQVDRKIWEQTPSYIKGMVDDLAKYKIEFDTLQDISAKKAIINFINSKYSDFDINEIQNKQVYQFLSDVRNGKYNNLEEKK